MQELQNYYLNAPRTHTYMEQISEKYNTTNTWRNKQAQYNTTKKGGEVYLQCSKGRSIGASQPKNYILISLNLVSRLTSIEVKSSLLVELDY